MKLKFIIIFSFFLHTFCYPQSTFSQLFGKFSFVQDSDTLLYCLFLPEKVSESYHFEKVLRQNLLLPVDSSKKYPLILFLHGAGERGNDNQLQLNYIDSVFANDNFQKTNPCFVLAPQCPSDKRWVEVDWNLDKHILPENPSISLKLVNSLIDSLISVLPIDENKIYITGLSMGGYGTWDFISRYPEKFAAAVPICGGGDENTASKIANIPIWCFHGAKDKVVKTLRSQNMINAIVKSGGNPKYTEYPELGHLCWNRAYSTPELYTWLFSQTRK
jgi:predicted peptidase